jgi:hypothetical protein
VEHTKRFIRYIERVGAELGEEAAARVILDIRQVKQSAKDFASDPESGKINKAKKVWGIIVETLFTYSYPPPTRNEVAAEIDNMDPAAFPSERSDTDYNFPIQVIDENLSLKDVLDAGWEVGLLHGKNWETLLNAISLKR